MFDFSSFIHIFYLVFLVVIAVGPGFITIANISMNYGYKKGMVAVLGGFTVDCFFITIGALAVKTILSFLPKQSLTYFSIVASLFLLYLAYGFWKTDEKKIKSSKVSKNYLSIYLKILSLGLSSPIAIIGYSAIFSTMSNGNDFLLSKLLGGYLASIIGHSLVVLLFGSIGKKIKVSVLVYINKISAILLTFFSFTLIFNFIKSFIY